MNMNLAEKGIGDINLDEELLGDQKVPTDRDEIKDVEKKEKRKMLVRAYTKDVAPLSGTPKKSSQLSNTA